MLAAAQVMEEVSIDEIPRAARPLPKTTTMVVCSSVCPRCFQQIGFVEELCREIEL